jgi:hypothetical protein
MPTQRNYRSSLVSVEKVFSPSRVVRFPEDRILEEYLPAGFGFDSESTIEIHFYSKPSNILQLSLVVLPTDFDTVLKSHVVTYEDGSIKHYLRIDFTELFVAKSAVLIPGEYNVVLNFFTDEVGAYDSRVLVIQEISPSRTELELRVRDDLDAVTRAMVTTSLQKFIEPSLYNIDASGAAEKIFISGVQAMDSTEGITFLGLPNEIASDNISLTEVLTRLDNTDASLAAQFEDGVHSYLNQVAVEVKQRIVESGTNRISKQDFEIFINEAIQNQLTYLQQRLDARLKIR